MQGHRCATLALTIASILLSGAVLPSMASAEDLAITIRPSGLSQIAEAATQFFPKEIKVEKTLERQIVNCPFTEEDTVIKVDDIVAAIEWNDLALRVDDGMLVVDANIDLDLGLHFSAVNFYACFGTIDCETSLSTTGIDIVASLALMSGEDGKVSLANSEVDVTLDMADFELDVEGCALGNLLEVVTDLLGNWVLDQLETPAENAIGEALSKKVAGLGFVLPDQIDREGFVLQASLNELLIDSEGIAILGDVSVVGPAGPVEASAAKTTAEPLPPSFTDGGIALAVTDSLISKSLAEAFVAGRFDSVLSEAVPTIELSQEGLSQKLGLPKGTTVDVSLKLEKAPTVSFGRKEDTAARVALSDLQIEILINSPGAEQGRVSVEAGAILEAGFAVTDGALGIRVQDLSFDKLKITTGGGSSLDPDPVRLQKFIRDVAVPMLSARLSNLPLAPVLQPREGTFVWVRGLEAEGGWLRLGVDLVMPDLDDKTAPETSLPSRQVVAAGMAAIDVDGSDNSTPTPLLRYTAWLDGELLTDKPTFLNTVHFSAADGEHVLEVAAHDLNGNVDDTPSRLQLIVDGTPPELVVESFPGSVIEDGVVAASWRAMDDRGTASTRWEIRVADGGTVRKVVASGEGTSSGELRVEALSESDIYVLHLIAEDEAGNVTSKEFGFAFEQGGGCSTTGSGNGAWLVALVLLAGLLRRRRRVFVPVALGMVAAFVGTGEVSAQVAGNALTGVTDADGASAFWNPAALAPSKGTAVDLTTNLTYIRLNYDNPDTVGSSNANIPKPQPTLGAYTDTLGERWRLGFTMGIPYTDGAKWSRGGAEGQTTRYYTADAKIVHALLTPAVSYKVNRRLAFGFGLNIDYASISAEFDKDFATKLNASAGGSADSPFPAGNPQLAAPVNFSMSGVGVGAIGGVFAKPSDRLKLGLSVHSPISTKASGQLEADYPASMVQFVEDAAPGAELPEVAGNADLTLEVPLAVFMGVAYEPARTWEVSADYRFLNYAETSNTDILISESTSPDLKDAQVVRGRKNRHSIGLRLNKSFLSDRAVVALRGRYENNRVAERTFTPSNMDFQKVELAATVRWVVSQRWAIAAQYSKFLMSSVTVDESLHRSVTDSNLDAYNHPAPLGTYTAAADMLSLGLTLKM